MASGLAVIPGATLRLIGRVGLGAVLIVGAAAAWQVTRTLEGRVDDLTRYVRVDAWVAREAEQQLQQFLLVLGRHVARVPEADLAAVRRELSVLRSAITLVHERQDAGDLRLFGDVGQLVGDTHAALDRVGRLLSERGDARGDVRLLSEIETTLAPSLAGLGRLTADLAHVRLELQDRDLANVKGLIALNQDMLVASVLVGSAFVLLLLAEARAARRAEGRARASETRFRDFAEIASDWLWETDADLRLTYVSEQTAPASGVSVAGQGSPAAELAFHADTQPGVKQCLEAMAARRPFRNLVYESHSDDASESRRTTRVSGKPFYDPRGRFLGYRGAATDITTEVRREQRIRFLAEYDQLTKLPNRTVFQDRLRECLRSTRRGDQQVVVYALDLDGFKEINDMFGHDIGDALLVQVAERLHEVVRDDDTLARLGGDEFAAIQTGVADAVRDANALASRLMDALRGPLNVCGKELTIGASIGIAISPADGDNVEDLLKAADLALYAAKLKGRSAFRFFSSDMMAQLRRKKRLETELRQAIANHTLEVHFQAQVDLRGAGLTGAEALVRWHHPELGNIPPGMFIPVAEETGLIMPLGQWILETACREAAGWSGAASRATVAVNVSPAQLMLQDLVSEVSAVLERTNLPAHRLELEITESLLMRDERLAIDVLQQLKEIGVQLAIDDFGTGYSSLSYLKRFPVHKVKIDKSFVGDLDRDQDDQVIVRGIVGLGQALGLRTIAEGVETHAQSDFLASLGCDEAQGYLFGKPMPAHEFRRILRHLDAASSWHQSGCGAASLVDSRT